MLLFSPLGTGTKKHTLEGGFGSGRTKYSLGMVINQENIRIPSGHPGMKSAGRTLAWPKDGHHPGVLSKRGQRPRNYCPFVWTHRFRLTTLMAV